MTHLASGQMLILTRIGYLDIIQAMSLTDNSVRPRQNGHHFTDDILKCILLNEKVWISINISLKFVPKGPINNIPALVQIMASVAPVRRQAIVWTNDG